MPYLCKKDMFTIMPQCGTIIELSYSVSVVLPQNGHKLQFPKDVNSFDPNCLDSKLGIHPVVIVSRNLFGFGLCNSSICIRCLDQVGLDIGKGQYVDRFLLDIGRPVPIRGR